MRTSALRIAAAVAALAWSGAAHAQAAPAPRVAPVADDVPDVVDETDEDDVCDVCDALEVKVAELESKLRRLESRRPDPAPALRVWEGTEVVPGTQWCLITELAPGEVLVSDQWLDADAGWMSTEVVGAGFPISQRGAEVGFRHLAPCGSLALAFRLVILAP